MTTTAHSSLRTAPLGDGAGALRWLPLRTPTLPPATHTNCVVLGRGRFVLVDPASPWPEEQALLLEALQRLEGGGETLAGILLTHHHSDHVGAAMALRAATGAPILAHARTAAKLAERVVVDRLLGDEQALADAVGVDGWRVVLTPGHAPGHLCAVSEDGVVAAGDMVAAIGTIVIEPDDDGDMAQYLASLERLRSLQPRCLVPAHGEPMFGDEADAKLVAYLRHRRHRESLVLGALAPLARSLLALVPSVYPEVPAVLHPLAARSLLAHLRKLRDEGRAVEDADGAWRSA